MKLTTRGKSFGVSGTRVGRISRDPVTEPTRRGETVFICSDSAQLYELDSVAGYKAVLSEEPLVGEHPGVEGTRVPVVYGVQAEHLRTGDIVSISDNGSVRTVYRPDSSSNFLFTTDRCNSNCLMCSQPPKDIDDSYLVDVNLQAIGLIEPAPAYLGITGGEPTLLGDGLFRQLEALRDRLSTTRVHILTNGRRFAWPEFARRLAEVRHPALSLGIPVYSDNASDHDYVVQAGGAFDQTMMGLYRLAEHGVNIEIRVVLHAQTIGRLRPLMEFIYRNIPFASHVALMGLEITGYTPHNLSVLWIDPFDYRADLLRAAAFLINRGMNVSIYNHPLCVLDRRLWPFARRSISDWKNVYLDACTSCVERNNCGGFFQSAEKRHSEHIRPFS